MLSRTITLASLVDARVPLSWRQAIALVQAIAEVADGFGSESVDSLAQMALDPSGAVVAATTGPVAISRSELALFLVQLLRPDPGEPLEPTPSGLYDAISRALGLSEEPAFESIAQFSAALSPFEHGSRQAALRSVYMRCMQHLNYTVQVAPTGDRHVAHATGGADTERRKTGAQVAALRRMLRELDRESYLMRAAADAGGKSAPRKGRIVSTFLPVSALAVAVLITAVAGNTQRSVPLFGPLRGAHVEPSSAVSGDVGPSSMIENRSKPVPVVFANRDVHAASNLSAAAKTPTRRLDRAAGEQRGRRGGEPVAHGRPPIAVARKDAATVSMPVPTDNARRWPRRVIAAIGRRLSSAFQGA